ncbi:MAG: exosortase/archaeosortase family protein [Candidatus Bathyarchaeia archaeon]
MANVIQILIEKSKAAVRVFPIFAFIIPLAILYALYPKSFEGDPSWEGSWQGRFFYIFFIWLAFSDIVLNWEQIQAGKVNRFYSARTFMLLVALSLPTLYVIAANFWGVNNMIADVSSNIIKNIAGEVGIIKPQLIPLATEYIVFAILFCLIISLVYGIDHLAGFSMPMFLLGITALLYIIDDLYPTGRFTPLQMFVPPTATLAVRILNTMGYATETAQTVHPIYGNIFSLTVRDPMTIGKSVNFGIAWPCAGVESIFIYTVTILLFLTKIDVAWWKKIAYFIIGAIITYFINVLRIVTIFLVALNNGDWISFHNIYGPLYSITWISLYPLIIIGTQVAWRKLRPRKH